MPLLVRSNSFIFSCDSNLLMPCVIADCEMWALCAASDALPSLLISRAQDKCFKLILFKLLAAIIFRI